jgi:peroxin-19
MEAAPVSAATDEKSNVAAPKLDDAKPASATTTAPVSQNTTEPVSGGVEDVPDPDEDDLDDLDDMLDEFATVKLEPPKSPAPLDGSQPKSAAKPEGPAAPAPNDDEPFSEEEFAKQLQEGMASLLGELEKSPDMQAQFENMFKQMASEVDGAEKTTTSAGTSASASTPGAGAKAGSSSTAEPASSDDQSFQETIRRTMERMQTSGDQATAAAAGSGGDDFMSEMLKQLSSGDLNTEGSEEEFSKMLMGMMEQLTNRDILYEPMKELHDKFPDWLEKNKAKTPEEDLKRYEVQQTVVGEIVAKFEDKSYSDSNAADREYIVDRMQKVPTI